VLTLASHLVNTVFQHKIRNYYTSKSRNIRKRKWTWWWLMGQ